MDVSTFLEEYYSNDCQKLHRVVDRILKRFPWIYDREEFYSLSNEVLNQALTEYDGNGDFDGFFYVCMSNHIKTEISKMNCQKRAGDQHTISLYLDIPDGSGGTFTLEDTLMSDYDIENDYLNKESPTYSAPMTEYLGSLSTMQRKILGLIVKGYKPKAIKERLGLKDREYSNAVSDLKGFEKTNILIGRNSLQNNIWEEEKMDQDRCYVSYESKTKSTQYSIAKIDRDMRDYLIRDDHELQRASGQWTNLFKSEFISDILQGRSFLQIIISEEVKGTQQIHWLIDGKQRCSTMREFLHDGFRISKNVSEYLISYQSIIKDEKGEVKLDDDGNPTYEIRTCDIRGKKFSKLPEDLQNRYKEFEVPIMLNLNSNMYEIAHDIARFNRSRPMTVAQNGWTGLDENFAYLLNGCLKLDFFKTDFEGTSFTATNHKKGGLRRMAVESIILANFPENYNKDFRKCCEFLSENGNDDLFTKFYTNVKRLQEVCTSETADLFNMKDSGILLAAFNEFTTYGLDDHRFVDFLNEFNSRLKYEGEEGERFVDINGNKSTKDKVTVLARLNKIKNLMKEYFYPSLKTNTSLTQWFISDATGIDIDEISEDMEFYEEELDDYEDKYLPDKSSLRDEQNRKSLLAIVAYSLTKDEDAENWFEEYFAKTNSYAHDQKQNFLHMKDDLTGYLDEKEKAG